MRRAIQISVLSGMVLLAGCGKAAPTGALAMSAVPKAHAAQPIIANNTGRLAEAPQAPVVADAPRYEDMETPPPGVELGPDADPVEIATATDEAPPSYRVDERTPYGVVVVERSAHTATIAWRTDVPTKGIVEYGHTWRFGKNGYTDSFRDDVAKTDHKITLTDLGRFRSYTFKVTAVTPLGLRFSDDTARKFRTKFWSWR